MKTNILTLGMIIPSLTACVSISSPVNEYEGPCDFEGYAIYYADTIQLFDLADDFILIGSDSINSNETIDAFLNSLSFINRAYSSKIYKPSDTRYKQIWVKLIEPASCNEVSRLINELKKNEIVDYAHHVLNSQCTDLVGQPVMGRCVRSYTSDFNVWLNDTSEISDLDSLASSTNTIIIGPDKNWPLQFTVRANKHADGDALTMSNYFARTGLFSACYPKFRGYKAE